MPQTSLYFEVLYCSALVKGMTHTRFIDASDNHSSLKYASMSDMAIQVFKIEVMHLRSTYKSHPLTRVQQYSTS